VAPTGQKTFSVGVVFVEPSTAEVAARLSANPETGGDVPAQAWVTLIVGTVATVGVLFTWRQKNNADNRAEWWRRTAWAIERTFSDNNTEAELGFLM
jgi:hypothetical protein